jgi:chemotaxis protein CheD
MNHFLLPETLGTSSPRFAAPAFEELRRALVLQGARPARLRAKLFGGAVLSAAVASDSIGARNVEAARRLLSQAAIPVLAEDVGGRHGRKLVFETHTGRAWVRALQSL